MNRAFQLALAAACICYGLLVFGVAETLLIAGPRGCQDIPLRVTLYAQAITDPTNPPSTIPSALLPDAGGEYVNGTSASALIKSCAGTNDAVLNVSATKRTFVFVFPNPIAGSVIEAAPSWVPGQQAVSGWINVRNITFNKGINQPFTTHVGSTFALSGERSTYRLGFMAYQTDAPDLHTDPSEIASDNTPFASSLATVYPAYPASCGPGSMPSWLVRATNRNSSGAMQVGTLHKVSTKGSVIHEAQYSMPFEIRIEAMACFAY